MKSNVSTLTVTPTISTSAYASGDCMGGLFKLKGVDLYQSGYIHTALLGDKDSEEATISLVIFSSKPSSTTFTDNAALDINDADLNKIIGIIEFSTYTTFSSSSVSYKGVQSIPYVLDNNSEIYCTLLCGGTPTYTATTDLTVTLGTFNDE